MVYCNKEKLMNFKLNDNNFYVLMDFDKTMTSRNSDDSWGVIQNPEFVNAMLTKETNELLEKYYPIELDYSLDANLKSEYMYEWYIKCIDLYHKYNLTYDKLLDCVKYGNIVLRDGLKDLLYDFYNKNIPVVILSAGIGNVIVEVLKLNNCLYDNIHIISNFLTFKDNAILPFDNKIIHSCNKNLDSLPDDFVNRISNKEHILLFGDIIEDINMVPKKDLNKALCFGFLEKNVETNFNFYSNAFDIVLTSPTSFYEVQDVLNECYL